MLFRRLLLLLTLFGLLAGIHFAGLSAQDDVEATEPPPQEATQEPTDDPTPPPVTVTGSEPRRMTAGQDVVLSVFGSNFTPQSTVRLVGVGLLKVTFVNSGALTAEVPDTVLPGEYGIRVSDPVGGEADSPNKLRVDAPAQPPAPPPTQFPTPEPPTPVPGEPALLVRNYSVNPSTVSPGGTVSLTLEIINQGSRAALGGSVAVDTGGALIAATGQALALLPDIGPGAGATVALSAVAAANAAAGPNSVSLTLSYRDFENKTYERKATITVTVRESAQSSQVTLSRYLIDPNPAVPGEAMTLTILATNTGTAPARQVLLRVATGSEGVLLAGPQGDTFPLGDLEPGASTGLDLPLIVGSSAKAGPQAQAFTLTYLNDDETVSLNGTMTIDIAKTEVLQPVLLLESYDFGKEVVEPGEVFTLKMNLQNVGSADASELLVTFGTVESSGSSGDGGGGEGTPDGSGSTTSTTPSTTFAPLGAGGTLYVGSVAADRELVTLEQDFIVSGSVGSGIYSLPITLRYRKPDGSNGQDNLRASIVVLAPPRLRINQVAPLPETALVGDTLSFEMEILNVGRKDVEFSTAVVSAENGEVFDGAESFIGRLKVDQDTTVSGVVSPTDEGEMIVTVTLNYLDDLNHPKTIVETYRVDVSAPEPPPDDFGEPPPQIMTPEPIEEPDDADFLGRLLLGLLGLGS